MEPTLLVGDRIFVSKYTYGYSKHSFPFSPPILNKRIFSSEPEYGDLIVFKTPSDNRTDFIKRLIGLPGDKIQFYQGNIILNDKIIDRKKTQIYNKISCGKYSFETNAFIENLPNFNESNSNQQHRFMTFIDIIYEKKIPLMIKSEVDLNSLCSAKSLKEPFKRTVSRLYEMTTQKLN